MAAFSISSPPRESVEKPFDALSTTSSTHAVPTDSQMNGAAAMHNAIDALLPTSFSNGDRPSQGTSLDEIKDTYVPDPAKTAESTQGSIIDAANGVKLAGPHTEDSVGLDSYDSIKISAEATHVADSSVPLNLTRGSSLPRPLDVLQDHALDIRGGDDIALDNTKEGSSAAQEAQVDTASTSLTPTHQALPGSPNESTPPVEVPNQLHPDEEMADAIPVSTKVAREREDDEDLERSAKRARTGTPADGISAPDVAQAQSSPHPMGAASVRAQIDTHPSLLSGPATGLSTAAPTPEYAPLENGKSPAPHLPAVDFGPITDMQVKILIEGIRNIKKSKSSAAFLKPVDAIALKIPQYYDMIKFPIDLSTMEEKLKTGKYRAVTEYVGDFDQMVQNSVIFNGAEHAVTQAARNIRAQLNSQLKRIPRAGESAPADQHKKPRKSSMSAPREIKPRVPRSSLGSNPPPPPVAPEQIYALDHDGMPQIRRHSSIADGRPKREIHKPPPKDLPYAAKPKKKKYQLELRFCMEILDEITRPVYVNSIAAPFLTPVDPVALNIPNYRSVIKKPMDLGTVRDKLQSGAYENAKEFEQDVRLIFANCYKFNGKEHPVSKSGVELERAFDEQWTKKNDWISKHAPMSSPQSPEADGSESEEEEPEEDDEELERQAQLDAIHGQFAQLSAQLLALQSQPVKKTKIIPTKKASKVAKGGHGQLHRKSSGVPSATSLPIRAEKKVKPKKKTAVKPITNAQKEEISEKIGMLSSEQMARAADIIKLSLRKAGRNDLADRAEDEMEYEIDQIPDEALHELLKLVRKNMPAAGKADDTDYRPLPANKAAPAANQGKARKNKPMKGAEQDLQIDRIKAQLDSFQGKAAGLGEYGDDDIKEEAVSSGDDSESGSESEEE